MRHTILTSSPFFRFGITVNVFLFSSLFLLFSCATKSSEHYGFLATLGNDTVSIESVTKQGNELTSDEVDRFPRVQIRHTVVTLNDDGSIKHLVMDIHTPSESSVQQCRKVVADVANNKVHLSKTDSTGTLNRDFATGGSMVVAHVPQMYSLYELYFAAAMKKAATSKLPAGTPVEMRQFYIDREFDRFPLGHATVTPLGGGKAEVYHDWLSGTGDAVMDSSYHLLSYSGNRTTYKVQVKRLSEVPDITAIVNHFTSMETKEGHIKSISVRDSVHAQIGNAVFFIDYGRPLLRGRTLLGDVIPYDYVWRTGANAATQFTTSAPIKLAGLQVPAGKYTLWTAPHTTGVGLIVNKQSGQWGTEYNKSFDLGEGRMTSETVSTPVEQFTISIVSKDATHGMLVMEWGTFRWTAPIEVVK